MDDEKLKLATDHGEVPIDEIVVIDGKRYAVISANKTTSEQFTDIIMEEVRRRQERKQSDYRSNTNMRDD